MGGLLLLAVTVRADAQGSGPLLHEFLPPDPAEDMSMSSTNSTGDFPGAVKTPSGTIAPPDVYNTAAPDRVYREPDRQQAGFRPDRDTSRSARHGLGLGPAPQWPSVSSSPGQCL